MINVYELDIRAEGTQSGIRTYQDILAAGMPADICMRRITFRYSPDIREIKITRDGKDVDILCPEHFPIATLYESVASFIAEELHAADNLIIKCNCLGCEGLAYMIRSRIHCAIIGVLHCAPNEFRNRYFNMDHIILCCSCGRSWLEKCKCTRPYSVICNGVPEPCGCRRERGEDFTFIWANGLAPHKGFEKVIPAIRLIAAKRKIRVLCLGGGGDLEKFRSDCANLPIEFLGLKKDLSEYYARSDCALFASESEACSFAGIEAMSWKLPVISTDSPGLHEMFDKVALFAAPEEFFNAMLRMLEDGGLRRELSAKSYIRYKLRYTARRMCHKTAALYRKICK